MPEYEALLAGATDLPLPQRIQLIEALWDTVPADSAPPLTDAWLAEIERRSAEFDLGMVRPVPWEEIRKDALRRAGTTVTNDSD